MPVPPVHAHAIHATTHLRRITGARHIAFGLEGLLRASVARLPRDVGGEPHNGLSQGIFSDLPDKIDNLGPRP